MVLFLRLFPASERRERRGERREARGDNLEARLQRRGEEVERRGGRLMITGYYTLVDMRYNSTSLSVVTKVR